MKRRLALIVISVFAIQPAFAQDSAALRGACKADYEKLCSGVMPGGGRIANCFKAKRDQLSDTCRTALQQANAKRTGN